MAENNERKTQGSERPDFATLAAHAGESRLHEDGAQEVIIPSVKPVYMSNTYVAASIDEMDRVFGNEQPGFVYSRYANPTTNELEKVVALLEAGQPANAAAFGSGMAAIHAALLASGLKAGDRIVASNDVYGQTWAMLNGQMRQLGINTIFVDATDLAETLTAIEANSPRLVIAETISNPLLKVAPVPEIVEAAHRAGALMLVDNTFATPYLVNPLMYGVDLVAHSATKYLSGHGDTMGGVVIAASEELGGELRRVRRDTGAVLSPHDAWLITRGIRTLPLRMERQCQNAAQIAGRLCEHPGIERVNYPGNDPRPLKQYYGIELAGAMLSFVIRGAKRQDVFRFMEHLRVIAPATTLGDLSTLMLYPVMSSHRWIDPEVRERIGISEGLVRLSVGIESPADIISDLEQALEYVKPEARR